MTQLLTADELAELVKATVQSMAMQIAVMPAADREMAFNVARLTLEDSMMLIGLNLATETAKNLIDVMYAGMRTTVAQMPEHGRA